MQRFVAGVLGLAVLAGAVLATGLADPLVKWRIERSLIASGVSDQRADCMAQRMVERLNVWQLYQLHEGLAAREGEPEAGYGLGELVKRLARVEDGEAVAVVTSSAALCAVGLG